MKNSLAFSALISSILLLSVNSLAQSRIALDSEMTSYIQLMDAKKKSYLRASKAALLKPCPTRTRESTSTNSAGTTSRSCVMQNSLGVDVMIPGWPVPLVSGISFQKNNQTGSYSVSESNGGIVDGFSYNIFEGNLTLVSQHFGMGPVSPSTIGGNFVGSTEWSPSTGLLVRDSLEVSGAMGMDNITFTYHPAGSQTHNGHPVDVSVVRTKSYAMLAPMEVQHFGDTSYYQVRDGRWLLIERISF
jgi:hypothetical protein